MIRRCLYCSRYVRFHMGFFSIPTCGDCGYKRAMASQRGERDIAFGNIRLWVDYLYTGLNQNNKYFGTQVEYAHRANQRRYDRNP